MLSFRPAARPAAWAWRRLIILYCVSLMLVFTMHLRSIPLVMGLVGALVLAASAFAQDGSPTESCPDPGTAPTPTAVAVTEVPIVVESTTDDYFVLYVKHDLDGMEIAQPVAVTRGEAGTTTLAENVEALPAARYRVEKYLIANPADIDGDCIDDLTDTNPVNSAAAVALSHGAVALPDQNTFETLAFDSGSASYLKFVLLDMDTARPRVYFQNTNRFRWHGEFLRAVGLSLEGIIPGHIIYDPELAAPDGSLGVYRYWIGSRYNTGYSFSTVARAYTLLAASMPLLENNLAVWIRNSALPHLRSDLPLYQASRLPLVFDEDVFAETSFLALNPGEGYGLLRAMDPDERPNPRDIVLYETLPNELPRVAGLISTVPQTPLSHVNLRAVQDGIPNAFIRGADSDATITALIDNYVRYAVTEDGWDLRAATAEEVLAHYESSRPSKTQTPERDLSITTITPLSQVGFNDWDAFGVKAANVAVLGTLGFPTGTVPDGFAIPFYFYDRFISETALGQETVLGKGSAPAEEKITLAADTKLIEAVEAMLAHTKFQTDFAIQDEMLDDLRDAIKDAQSPQWIIDALTTMHAAWPEGQSLRYRSSTNNEDLPGFKRCRAVRLLHPETGRDRGRRDRQIAQAGVCQPVELPGVQRTGVPSRGPSADRHGCAGASELHRRTGQRCRRQF